MTAETAKRPGVELGVVGLGVMGRNLLLNIAEHGFSGAGYDKDPAKVRALEMEGSSLPIAAESEPAGFVERLRKPRAVLMLVPAGPPVDSVIKDLTPWLGPDDLLIDAGNSYFLDTDRRSRMLAGRGISYLGVGISGGEEGARRGPSIMPGGPKDAYERVRPVFEAIAAKVGAELCVAYLGPGSAGHFAKMVHNGIEYALMELIAETYDLMKRGLGLENERLAEVYSDWAGSDLGGFLMDITAAIFRRIDESTGRPLIDLIRGVSRQLGTGAWTSQSAGELQVPVPTIDAAVAQRSLSALENERLRAGAILPPFKRALGAGHSSLFLGPLSRALHAAMMIAYAQGLALLRTASTSFGYGYDLEAVARIWRGGCIIRSRMLEGIREAYRNEPGLPNVLLDKEVAAEILFDQEPLRLVVREAAATGIPAPGLMSALAYLDGYRSPWLPANLIQAQRDYFGAHTYERVDAPGVFHTVWKKG